MRELVSTKEKPLQMQISKKMVDRRHVLRHTIVVGVFGLEGELEVSPRDGGSRLKLGFPQTAITTKAA